MSPTGQAQLISISRPRTATRRRSRPLRRSRRLHRRGARHAQRHHVRRPARGVRTDHGGQRGRQVDRVQAAAALLRPGRGVRTPRRRTAGRPPRDLPARADHPAAAGDAEPARHDPREHRVRAAGGHRRGGGAGGHGRRRAHLHLRAARRLRHSDRPGHGPAVRRAAPARRHRPRDAARRARTRPGRAHHRPGRARRQAGHRAAAPADGGAYDALDHARSEPGPGRRPRPGPGPRPDRRARDPSRAGVARRRVRPAVRLAEPRATEPRAT